MALIALEGMRFYAYHGFYPEEQIIGNEYVIDIYIDANTQVAAATDDLYRTVNYETVYLICQAEMRKPTQLLEALVQRIASKINDIFSRDVKGLKVRVKKMNPPLRGRVDCSFVEIDNLSSSGKGGGAPKGFGGFENMNFGGGSGSRDDYDQYDNVIPDFGGAPEREERSSANLAAILAAVEEEDDDDDMGDIEEDLDLEVGEEDIEDEDLDFDEDDLDLDMDMDDLDMDFDDLDLDGFDFDED